MTQDNESTLRSNPWFAALPPVLQGMLARRFDDVRLPDGKGLFLAGSPPDGIWTVVEGKIRLGDVIAEPGVGRVIDPGGWIGFAAAVDRKPQPHNAFAVGPTHLLHISQEKLDFTTASEPMIFRHLALLLAGDLRRFEIACSRPVQHALPARLAGALIELAKTSGSSEIPLRQAEIAKLVGVTRQTVSGALKRLEGVGAIGLSYGRVTIRNINRLSESAKAAG